MKVFKALTALALALLLCLGLSVPAFAAGEKPDYANIEWDELMQQLLEEYGVDPAAVAAGYRNLVTGEEHFLNGDTYMIAGSMYKLPLCMYCTELIQRGEIDWSPYEANFSYKDKQDSILLYSSNEDADFLYNNILGGYTNFREQTAEEYMGVDPAQELENIQMWNNTYCAREFIHCLNLLYTERERFPDIIETMQQALPNRFFKLNEPRFRIAHKYGEWEEYGVASKNDCGLCFTVQPIAIVMFTRGVYDPETFLSAYATAMCEYTEARAVPPSPSPTPEATPAPAAVPAETPVPATPAPTPRPIGTNVRLGGAELPLIPVALTGLFLLLGLILVVKLSVRYRARFLPLLLSLLLSTAAILTAVAGTFLGTVYAKPTGDPVQTVQTFFDALCTGDYPRAYEQLRDYSDLGLDIEPSSAAAKRLSQALHQSYAYSLSGPVETDKLTAVQGVRFRYLSMPAIEADVEAETKNQIEHIVNTRAVGDVYDADKRYKPEVAEEAYLAALDAVLAHAEDYTVEEELRLELRYTNGRWQLLADPALLRAINGGTAI